MPPGELATEPLTAADIESDFECGVAPLDAYFRKHALPNHERGVGRAYVLHAPAGSDMPVILGFYTLSMAQLEREALPDAHRRRLPAYPLPVALIGRFAVDKRIQRGGFGTLLLSDALQRVAQVSDLVGRLPRRHGGR